MKDSKQKLDECFASLETTIKEVKAQSPEDDKYMKMCQALWDSLSSLRQYVYRVDDNSYARMSDHTEKSTHLPKLTASQTEKLLKSCGASEDFQVAKPMIYARASRNGNPEFQVELNLKKKE